MAGSFMQVSFCPSEICTEFRFNLDGLSSLFSESSRLGNSKLTQVLKDSLEAIGSTIRDLTCQLSTFAFLQPLVYSMYLSLGEAVIVAQEVVNTMAAKGYDLGQDALIKAKSF